MRIHEIVNIPDLRGDYSIRNHDEFLRDRWKDVKSKIKYIEQLPNGIDIWGKRWPLIEGVNYLYFKYNDEIIGSATISYDISRIASNTFIVKIINILSRYQQKGTGFYFYSFLLNNGYKIISDIEHTKSSKKLWQKISKNYTARIYNPKTEELGDPIDDINKAYQDNYLKVLLSK